MSLTILSLGAGVQSSTLALMSEAGQLPKLDCAIFADTGSEPKAVYEWLNWLEAQVSFPIYRVELGNLTKDAVETRVSKRSGNRYCRNSIPVFTKTTTTKGQMPRTCTSEYKIRPIRKKIRQLLKDSGETLAKQWIGISTDEAHRMKDSQVGYVENVFPLIDLDMSRASCLQWAESRGIKKPPRSACVYCPFHSDKQWLEIKTEDPDMFEMAIKFEKDLQRSFGTVTGWKDMGDPPVPFLHKSRIPLGSVEFDGENQLDLFGQECEGMCGL